MTASIYHSLDHSTSEIRLLHVFPAPSVKDGLRCGLRIVALDDKPRFEAISYAWGDVNHRQSLVLEGESCSISQNLADALCHFRSGSHPIELWADQLCINQNDADERNQQVRLMARIYRQALRVRIWLGKAGPQNEKLMEILSGRFEITETAMLASTRGRVDAVTFSLLTILLTRPWWTRLWVLQEVVLAREAHLYCGTQYVSLRTLLTTSQKLNTLNTSEAWNSSPQSTLERTQFIRTLQRKLEIFSFLQDLREQTELAEEYRETQATQTQASQFVQATQATQPLLFEGDTLDDQWIYSNFLRIIVRCRGYFASDARDKVYALLGLLPERLVSAINPDYTQSSESVHAHITRLILHHTQSLLILHFANGFAPKAKGPSWAIQLATFRGSTEEAQFRLRMQQLDIFNSSAGIEPFVEVFNDSLLLLRGLHLNTVQFKTEGVPSGRPTSMESLVSTLRLWSAEVRRVLHLSGFLEDDAEWNDIDAGKFFKKAFVCSLVGGTIPADEGNSSVRQLVPSDFDPTYDNVFNKLFDTVQPDILYREYVREDSLSNHLIRNLHGKCVFITAKGLIGVGPAEMSLGDEVFILAGGKKPFVLRPTSNIDNHHVLVGDAYIYGLMHGLSEVNEYLSRLQATITPDTPSHESFATLTEPENWKDVYIGE